MSRERLGRKVKPRLNSRSLAEIRRMEALLDEVKHGKSARVLYERKRSDIKETGNSTEIGRRRENNAARVLRDLPEVEGAEVTDLNSEEDKRGIDIIVRMREESSVYVQVKSSYKDIKKFKQKISLRYGVHRAQVVEWLLSNRYIVINGALDDSRIVSNFYIQLDQVRQLSPGELPKQT